MTAAGPTAVANLLLDVLIAREIDEDARRQDRGSSHHQGAAVMLALQGAPAQLLVSEFPDGTLDLTEFFRAFVSPLTFLVDELAMWTNEPVESVVSRLREHLDPGAST